MKEKSGDNVCAALPASVCLWTLATKTDWHQDNFGFEQVSVTDVPSVMVLEVAADSVDAKLI